MRDDAANKQEEKLREAGLCHDCRHARMIQSDRASIFLQCELSFTDPQFAKYPRLPVRTCRGYLKQVSNE